MPQAAVITHKVLLQVGTESEEDLHFHVKHGRAEKERLRAEVCLLPQLLGISVTRNKQSRLLSLTDIAALDAAIRVLNLLPLPLCLL